MAQQPQQTYYIVLPPQKDAAGYARQISRLMQKEEAEVAPKLSLPTYTLLRRYARRGNAESFRDQLAAFGIRTILVSDTAIAGHLFIWARDANKGAGGLAFRDFEDQPTYCPFEDIVSVCTGTVAKKDGSTALFIDLHRKSTPITPRLDAGVFDFASVVDTEPKTAEAFLEQIFDPSTVHRDDEFNGLRGHMAEVAHRGLATFPGNLMPPADDLPGEGGYDRDDLRLFNVYSFLAREERLADMGSI